MSDTLLNLRVIPTLPKKYEDTKPALNQAYTHAAILGKYISPLAFQPCCNSKI